MSQDQLEALARFRSRLAQGIYEFEMVPCLCGNADGRLISRRDRYALSVGSYLCKSCGIMWTTPRMTEDSLARFYEIDYRPIYAGPEEATEGFFAEQVQHGRKIYQSISHDVQSGQDPVVFDVGCGAGGTLMPFVEAGWRAFGCDLGTEYLMRGRGAGPVLEQGDVAALQKYSPAKLVILNHVLEHLPDPLSDLKQISTMLAADGYVYVELPGIFNIHRAYGDVMLYLQNAHLYHFTLTTLASLMARAGLRLMRGDESIRALFRKDGDVPAVSTSDEYRRVSAYLNNAELVRVARVTRCMATRVIRRVVGDHLANSLKAILGLPRA